MTKNIFKFIMTTIVRIWVIALLIIFLASLVILSIPLAIILTPIYFWELKNDKKGASDDKKSTMCRL